MTDGETCRSQQVGRYCSQELPNLHTSQVFFHITQLQSTSHICTKLVMKDLSLSKGITMLKRYQKSKNTTGSIQPIINN